MVLLSNTGENTTAGSRRAPALDNRIYSLLASGRDQWKRSDERRRKHINVIHPNSTKLPERRRLQQTGDAAQTHSELANFRVDL